MAGNGDPERWWLFKGRLDNRFHERIVLAYGNHPFKISIL